MYTCIFLCFWTYNMNIIFNFSSGDILKNQVHIQIFKETISFQLIKNSTLRSRFYLGIFALRKICYYILIFSAFFFLCYLTADACLPQRSSTSLNTNKFSSQGKHQITFFRQSKYIKMPKALGNNLGLKIILAFFLQFVQTLKTGYK